MHKHVLDHGFVKLRNISGPTRREWQKYDANDLDPAQSARISFDDFDSEYSEMKAMGLNRYLIKNRHNTPLQTIEVWIEMKMPIFVARQFVRHRTANINEVSARYVQLPAEWYIPRVVGGKPIGGAKQGQSDTLDAATQEWFREALNDTCRLSYQNYEAAIANGVAAEHARLFLHVNHYTHWLWKQDLWNMMNFFRLRDHGHAQIEAQAYGKAMIGLLEPELPGLMALYKELISER